MSADDKLVVGWVTQATIEKLREDTNSFYAIWAEARGSIDQALVPASALEAYEARIAALTAERDEAAELVTDYSGRLMQEQDDHIAAMEVVRALTAENATLREKVERGEHLARTVSQTRFRLETNDRYSISLFDADNMVGLARADGFRAALRQEGKP